MIKLKDIRHPEIIEYIKNNIRNKNSTNNGFIDKRVNEFKMGTSYDDYIQIYTGNSYLYIDKLIDSSTLNSYLYIDKLIDSSTLKIHQDLIYKDVSQGVSIGDFFGIMDTSLLCYDKEEETLYINIKNLELNDVDDADEILFNILLHKEINEFHGHKEVIKSTLDIYAFINENIK